MKKNDTRVTSGQSAGVSRRGFLGSVAAGVAASSCLSFDRTLAPAMLEANAPAAGQTGAVKTVLSAEDFQYAGLFTLPNPSDGVRFGFSNGAMTARRINGELRFFVAGAKPSGDPVYEVTYPGHAPTLAGAPRSSLIRSWGDVYRGKRLIQSTGGITTRGLHWANDQLYWTYGDEYNVAGLHDPSIGTSVLLADGNVQVYGPWRTQEHSQKTRGYMVSVPSWFTPFTNGGELGIGAPITSGNATSPWGAALAACPLPSNGTPADTPGTSHLSIRTQRLIYHDINQRQRRDTNYRACDWVVKYDASKGKTIAPGAPVFTSLDMLSAAAWVDLPTKHGVLFFGQIVAPVPGRIYEDGDTLPHYWYGPNICPHGQNGSQLSVSTGDAAGSMAALMMVYDPANLVKAAKGDVDPWSFEPASIVPINTISTIPAQANSLHMFGGAYFDAETRSVFVSQVAVDPASPYESQPVIHVFTITG
jgi:hypothetical protein